MDYLDPDKLSLWHSYLLVLRFKNMFGWQSINLIWFNLIVDWIVSCLTKIHLFNNSWNLRQIWHSEPYLAWYFMLKCIKFLGKYSKPHLEINEFHIFFHNLRQIYSEILPDVSNVNSESNIDNMPQNQQLFLILPHSHP